MKEFPLLGLCILAFVTPTNGATGVHPNIDWIRAFNTDAHEHARGIASGSNGTLYLSGSLPAGNLQIGNTLVSSNGTSSHTIVSISQDGDGLNSYQPTSGEIVPGVISVDPIGNIVIAGGNRGSVLGSRVLSIADNRFVALLSPSGTWINAGAYDALRHSLQNVTADAVGNIYVCGDLQTSVTSGNHTFSATFGNHTISVPTIGESHGYVAKLNAAGNWEWVLVMEHTGATSIAHGSRILDTELDSDGNVVVLGRTLITASFANNPLGDGSRSFVARISPSGSLLRLRTFNSIPEARAMHADRQGQIYVAGESPNSILDLDPLVSAINTNQANFYVARMDSTGQFVWGRPGYHSADWISLDALSTDEGGNIYLGGWIESGSVTFGTDTITGNTNGGFVAAMNPAGAWMWAVELPTGGDDFGASLRSVHLAGTGSNSVYFSREFKGGPVTVGTSTFTNSADSLDMYFGKISNFDPSMVPPPVITRNPSPVKTLSGGTATFDVVATGTNVHYQWLRDGTPLVPANGPSLFMVQLTRANQGNYSVQVWNSGGTNTSNPARLQVLSPVQIGPLERDNDGRFGFRFFDPSAFQFTTNDAPSFDVLVSTNLLHWQPITGQVTWTDGAIRFTDHESTNAPTRFYRTREQ